MVDHVPPGYHTVTPYLVSTDVERLLGFCKQAFGAEERECLRGGDGRIVHAEARLGDSIVMMGQERQEEDSRAYEARLYVYVPDVDATFARALEAGATSVREPADQFYGDRSGGLRDPLGNEWWVATHVEDVSLEELRRRTAETK